MNNSPPPLPSLNAPRNFPLVGFGEFRCDSPAGCREAKGRGGESGGVGLSPPIAELSTVFLGQRIRRTFSTWQHHTLCFSVANRYHILPSFELVYIFPVYISITNILVILIISNMNKAELTAREQELKLKLETDRAHRKAKMILENKILEVQLEQLKLVKQHYEEHQLKVDLKSYESKLNRLVSKSRYTVLQTSHKRLDDLQREFDQQNEALDKEITDLTNRLDQYKRLDPTLLAEYRKLKEDLDCQNLLIEMSGGNVDKLLDL